MHDDSISWPSAKRATNHSDSEDGHLDYSKVERNGRSRCPSSEMAPHHHQSKHLAKTAIRQNTCPERDRGIVDGPLVDILQRGQKNTGGSHNDVFQ